MRNFATLKQTWSNCTNCSLSETRQRVVLLRGHIPCHVLFIGEAPGESEDTLGKPFVGPAGQLLDHLISLAEGEAQLVGLKKSFTNLVACIPRDENNDKISEPPKKAIEACQQRLLETIELCRPRLIVFVSDLANKHAPKACEQYKAPYSVAKIMHPAFILRANVAQRSLLEQRCVVVMADAFEELFK